jgi:hypothetical protein
MFDKEWGVHSKLGFCRMSFLLDAAIIFVVVALLIAKVLSLVDS